MVRTRVALVTSPGETYLVIEDQIVFRHDHGGLCTRRAESVWSLPVLLLRVRAFC